MALDLSPEQKAIGEANFRHTVDELAKPWSSKNAAAVWVRGNSFVPRLDSAIPCTECVWAQATTSGRARWTAECIS